DYQIIVPLMFAVVVATTLGNLATRDTIYTLKLRRRGIDVEARRPHRPMAQTTVAEAMGEPPRPLRIEQPLKEVIARFAEERSDSLPVTEPDGSLLGVLAAVDVEQALTHDVDRSRVAAELIREAPTLQAHQSLEDAVAVLAAVDDEGVPVVDDQ